MHAPSRLKAILWDNDGVLVNTEHLYFEATRQVFAEAGAVLEPHMYRDVQLSQNSGAWDQLRLKGCTGSDIEGLRRRRSDRYRSMLEGVNHAVPGIVDVLQSLHGRYLMGIVTTSRREHFEIIHASSGLLHYFDFVLAREDYEKSKPHPEPYLAGIAKTKCDADECVAIEDTPRGLTAAVRAGLRCVAVRTPWTTGSDFSAAWRIVDGVSELSSLFA